MVSISQINSRSFCSGRGHRDGWPVQVHVGRLEENAGLAAKFFSIG